MHDQINAQDQAEHPDYNQQIANFRPSIHRWPQAILCLSSLRQNCSLNKGCERW
jgi:hypothetical protein